MTHVLHITFVSGRTGDTYGIDAPTEAERSTPTAHELCRKHEAKLNTDLLHSQLAPWKVLSWSWQS